MSGRYIEKIEHALGVAVEGKTRVSFSTFDFERRLGVSVTYPSGKRHAVKVEFAPGWDDDAIGALIEWQGPRKAELGLERQHVTAPGCSGSSSKSPHEDGGTL
jgi:hypothetical protein